jgi:hypothetical protein
MAKPPPRTDEEIAKAAMLDIAGNVTGRDQWKDYDERYVTQRSLHAIREAKGVAALAFFLIPFAAHAQNFTYKGVIVHQGTATKCIGPEVHARRACRKMSDTSTISSAFTLRRTCQKPNNASSSAGLASDR